MLQTNTEKHSIQDLSIQKIIDLSMYLISYLFNINLIVNTTFSLYVILKNAFLILTLSLVFR